MNKVKGIAVCIPLYLNIPTQFFNSFLTALNVLPKFSENVMVSTRSRTYVYLSRRSIAEEVLKNKEMEYFLWIDQDQVFGEFELKELIESSVKEKADVMAGMYVTKDSFKPLVFEKGKDGYAVKEKLPFDTVVEADAVGFGFTLVKRNVVEDLQKKYGLEKVFNCKNLEGRDIGEDFLFCELAKKEGFTVKANTKIRVGHAGGVITPEMYYIFRNRT